MKKVVFVPHSPWQGGKMGKKMKKKVNSEHWVLVGQPPTSTILVLGLAANGVNMKW